MVNVKGRSGRMAEETVVACFKDYILTFTWKN
jgi:hypothetical protein